MDPIPFASNPEAIPDMVTPCSSQYEFFAKSNLKGVADEEALLSKTIGKELVSNEYNLEATIDKVFSRNVLDKSECC